jgi:hypothetical protein
MEPQLFKLGFFFLLERRVRLTPRVVAFASPVRLKPRVFEKPIWKDRLFCLLDRRVRTSGSVRRLCFASSAKASGLWKPRFVRNGVFVLPPSAPPEEGMTKW